MKNNIFIALMLLLSIHIKAQMNNDSCVHLHEIVVTGLTGGSHINHIPSPVSVISANELQRLAATNIIDAISKHPGISQITTGGGISKPVIRGLGYNRILTVNDGIRQEGQQWGDEHGLEVDGDAVHSVEVIKGPASLMYGSDAMAGVIILHDAPILPINTIGGNVSGGYQTNGHLWQYSANIAGNQSGFVWNWRWSQKHSDAYKNPRNGTVNNSQFAEQALNSMLGFNKNWGYSHLKMSYYHLKPGIVEAGEEEEENNEEAEEESPFQQIHHYKVVWDQMLRIGNGQLKTLFGYQQNRRQEYEEPEECGLDFQLHTFNYDLRYVTPEWNGWLGNLGVNGMWQQSRNLGDEYLIPAYHLFDMGLFTTFSKDFHERLHINGGVRIDNRRLHSHELYDEDILHFESFTRSFTGFSMSTGIIYNISPSFDIRANIARGFRAPNLSELGSNGEHEGTLRYEIGNKELKAEGSWQLDLGIDYSSDFFSAKVALFANRIDNFIFLEKNGLVVGDKDVFSYRQHDARLLGFETTVIIHPLQNIHYENSFSFVNAQQIHASKENKYLPFIPSPRWLSTLHYDIPNRGKTFRDLFAEVEMDCNLRQSHVCTANDTETETPSYTLWNCSAGTNIHNKKGKMMNVSLTIQNIFDRIYVNHLNRLKEGGIYNMGRNIVMKVSLPLNIR